MYSDEFADSKLPETPRSIFASDFDAIEFASANPNYCTLRDSQVRSFVFEITAPGLLSFVPRIFFVSSVPSEETLRQSPIKMMIVSCNVCLFVRPREISSPCLFSLDKSRPV